MTQNIEQDILSYITNHKKDIQCPDATHPNAVLVLGNTGAGKSTYVQYIAGDNSKIHSVEVLDGTGESTGDYTIKDSNSNQRIGSDTAKSYTTIPELVFDAKTNTSIYDCPGFSDNRNATQDIAGSYFIRLIIDNAAALKFVFLIDYAAVTTGTSKTEFNLLANHATTIIKNLAKFKDGISLVATKVKDVKKDVQIIRSIATYLNSTVIALQNQTSKTDQDKKTIEFITILLQKKDKTYTKIGFMKQPTIAGPLSLIEDMQKHKLTLLELLHKNTTFIRNDNPSADFDNTISSDSLNYVSNLMLEINNEILNQVNVLVATMQQCYANSVQDMVTIIGGFENNVNIANVHINQLEARTFIGDFSKGKSIMEKLAAEMLQLTNPDDLYTKLNREIASLSIHKIQVSNNTTIYNLATLYKFLRRYHNPTFPAQQLSKVFIEAKKHLLKLLSDLHKKVIIAKNQVEGKITLFFLNKEETITDVRALFRQIDNQHQKLTDIREKVGKITTLTACIHQIDIHLSAINNTGSEESILSLYVSRYGNYLKILKDLSEMSDQTNNSFTCTEGLDNVLQYSSQLKGWYSFLLKIFDQRLSTYDIQKDIATYNNIIDAASITKYQNNTIRGFNSNLQSFFQLCCKTLYDIEYNSIANIKLDKFKLNALQKIIDLTLKYNLVKNFDQNESKLVIEGQFVKLSDIDNSLYSGVKYIEIFALNKVFIDITLNKTGKLLQLSIIAPTWDIQGDPQIILNGTPGAQHNVIKAQNNGNPGLPGLPGGSAGNFFGFGEICNNAKHLTITANGGKGGPGQEGGDGIKGKVIDETAGIERSGFVFPIDNPLPGLINRNYRLNLSNTEDSTRPTRTVLWFNRVWEFIVYKDGSNGGDGGDGGQGGKGGKPGDIIMTFTNSAIPHFNNMTGEIGLGGSGGRGGEPGSSNEVVKVRLKIQRKNGPIRTTFDEIKSSTDERVYIFPQNLNYKINYTSGNAGATGRNIIGMNEAQKTHVTDLSHIVNRYKKFLRENLADSFQETDLRNFLHQLDHNDLISKFYHTSGFVNELYTLEEYYNHLYKTISFLSFYTSLLPRITKYSQNLNPSEKSLEYRKILSYLYTAIMSRICAINKPNNGFIVDLIPYLQSLSNDIKNLNDVTLAEQINKVKNTYQTKITTKINEAAEFVVNEVTREIDEIFQQTDNKIQSLINEISTMKNESLKEMGTLREKKSKLQTELVMRSILGIAQTVGSLAAVFTGPVGIAVGGAIGGVSMTVQTLAFDDTSSQGSDKITPLPSAIKSSTSKITDRYSSKHQFLKIQLDIAKAEVDGLQIEKPNNKAVDEIRQEISQLKKEVDDGNYNIIAPQHPQTELKDKLKELKQKLEVEKLQGDETEAKWKSRCLNAQLAISAIETGVDVMSRIKNNNAKIDQTYALMNAVEDKLIKLQKHEDDIYSIMLPTIRVVQESVKTLDEKLPGQSLAALDIKKWKIQSTIKDLKVQIAKMTEGFKVEKDVKRCIDKLEDAMETVIQIYDRIEQYKEHKQFADYIYQITTPKANAIKIENTELSDDFNKLKVIIHSNYVLIECTKAINAFLQFIFPFANRYLEQFESISQLRMENTTVNLVHKAVEKIDYIKSQLEKRKASNDAIEDGHTILNEVFDDKGEHPPPFFVWKFHDYSVLISQLLQGKEITLNADITDTPIIENSVKFNDIWIRFKLANATLQTEFDDELGKLSIEMTHLGNSYYRCGNKIYVINHESQLIDHTVKTTEAGVYGSTNRIYLNLKTNEPVLSPYAFWKMRLFRTKLNENYDFSALNKYLNQTIDIHLEGRGSYIRSKYTKDVCQPDLENYYTLHKVISENDYNAHYQRTTRRRRYAVENQEKPTYVKSDVATSSAGRITSSISCAINWFKDRIGLGQLSFLNPSRPIAFIDTITDDIKDTVTSINNGFNINDSLILADFLVKYFTKGKSFNTDERTLDPLELKAYVLDIVTNFETLLDEISNRYNFKASTFQFDPVILIAKLEQKIVNGNFSEIRDILYESVTMRDRHKELFQNKIEDMIRSMHEQENGFSQNQRSAAGNLLLGST